MAVYVAGRKYLLAKSEQEALSALHESIQAESNRHLGAVTTNRLHAIVELLLQNKEHNTTFDKTAKYLICKHLPELLTLKTFRTWLERRDRANILKLVEGAVERGYQFQD